MTTQDERMAGISEKEKQIMERLLRAPHEQQKETAKPDGARAEAQQRRRRRERDGPNEVLSDA